MLISSTLPRKSLPPLLATLKAATDAIQRGSSGAAINQLRAFQNKVRAQIASSDPALAAHLIDMAQRIIDSTDPAPRPKLANDWAKNSRAVHVEFKANPAHAYVIEASSDMIHWEAIGVAQYAGQGKFGFLDLTKGADTQQRFYRVRVP